MNLRIRLVIARIKPLHQLMRWFMYNKGAFFYKRLYKERGYEQLFNLWKNSKKGKRCFLIGNGPSLKVEDLEKLKNEDCFGVNEIHRIFSQTTWRPQYITIKDRYTKSTPEEIEKLDCEMVFLGDYYWRYNPIYRKDAICVREIYGFNTNKYKFSGDLRKGTYSAPTVVYTAMQIIAHFGYSEVYLLGFDHSYTFEFDKKGRVINTGKENTHFFKDDKASDIIGNVWGMTKAYEAFKEYADKNGIIVKNATRGGKLEIFERVDFDSLFRE